ncbi:hypothetical protein C5G87_22175 [Paenibacillus peoriae]|nr:hypothetical protein C5G87_22175 [Paenibacillus peoriae]
MWLFPSNQAPPGITCMITIQKKKIPVNIPLIIQKKAHLANRSSKFISKNSIILRIAVYYGEVSRIATPNRYAGKDTTNGKHPYNRTRNCTMDGRADP